MCDPPGTPARSGPLRPPQRSAQRAWPLIIASNYGVTRSVRDRRQEGAKRGAPSPVFEPRTAGTAGIPQPAVGTVTRCDAHPVRRKNSAGRGADCRAEACVGAPQPPSLSRGPPLANP